MISDSSLDTLMLIMSLGIICAMIASYFLAKSNKKLDQEIADLKQRQIKSVKPS